MRFDCVNCNVLHRLQVRDTSGVCVASVTSSRGAMEAIKGVVFLPPSSPLKLPSLKHFCVGVNRQEHAPFVMEHMELLLYRTMWTLGDICILTTN